MLCNFIIQIKLSILKPLILIENCEDSWKFPSGAEFCFDLTIALTSLKSIALGNKIFPKLVK